MENLQDVPGEPVELRKAHALVFNIDVQVVPGHHVHAVTAYDVGRAQGAQEVQQAVCVEDAVRGLFDFPFFHKNHLDLKNRVGIV